MFYPLLGLSEASWQSFFFAMITRWCCGEIHVHDGKKPHVHVGYFHDEYGIRNLTTKEKRLVDSVMKIWYHRGNQA